MDNFSIGSGAHTTKFGVVTTSVSPELLSYNQSAGGTYLFNSLSAYLARDPAQYTQFTGNGSVDLTIHEIAGYVQDEWRVLPGVTINPGLRYEAQLNPNYYPATAPLNRYPGATTIPDDTTMLAPRLGVAWDVGNAGKTVLRAGGGLYYAPTYMSMFAQSILFNGGNPDRAYSVSISNTSSNPNAIQNAFSSVGVNLATAPLTDLPAFTPSQFSTLEADGTGSNSGQFHVAELPQSGRPTMAGQRRT